MIQNNEYDDVLWTGDLNADFGRRTKFVRIVEDFLSKRNVRKSWDHFPVDFTHVTEREGKTFTSVLDHFLWNEGFHQNVLDAGHFSRAPNALLFSNLSASSTLDFAPY